MSLQCCPPHRPGESTAGGAGGAAEGAGGAAALSVGVHCLAKVIQHSTSKDCRADGSDQGGGPDGGCWGCIVSYRALCWREVDLSGFFTTFEGNKELQWVYLAIHLKGHL